MSSFKLPKAITGKPKMRSPQVAFRLTDDLVEPFHNLLEESGMSLAQLVSSMVRHCLSDLGKLDSKGESNER